MRAERRQACPALELACCCGTLAALVHARALLLARLMAGSPIERGLAWAILLDDDD